MPISAWTLKLHKRKKFSSLIKDYIVKGGESKPCHLLWGTGSSLRPWSQAAKLPVSANFLLGSWAVVACSFLSLAIFPYHRSHNSSAPFHSPEKTAVPPTTWAAASWKLLSTQDPCGSWRTWLFPSLAGLRILFSFPQKTFDSCLIPDWTAHSCLTPYSVWPRYLAYCFAKHILLHWQINQFLVAA